MQTFVFAVVVLSVACLAESRRDRPVGGLGRTKNATPEIQQLVDSVQDEIIGQLPLGYDREQPLQLHAVTYRDQIVAGRNYFIKVETGFGRYIHVRIYKDLSGNASVSSVQLQKSLADPIEYF
ncbi:cystatin-A3 [Magallana gigas]|uniref:Cystatin domain-containing protein n=1 Tax=Magallana gigas TaxID=29159 RepID=A0A8W8LPH4_MAGGI|nr:cystatin-A3 isoform X1 [Crassostrea gigas]